MYASCWASFSSIIPVPVPCPGTEPCRESWNLIALNLRSIHISTTFQIGSNNLIPQYCPLPFGMRTTISNSICLGISPVVQIVCTSWTNSLHLSPASAWPLSSRSSFLIPLSHPFMSSLCILEAPPALPFFRLSFTASLIWSSKGTSSSTLYGVTLWE